MYDGSHSITFGDGTFNIDTGRLTGKNTWLDWHLIPASRPDVATPNYTQKMVVIPGHPGALDLSVYLTGNPIYENRTGSWDFIVDNYHESWVSIKNNVMSYLHGQRMKCILDDDPGYYYMGRFKVDSMRSDSSNSRITISYVLDPFIYRIDVAGDWLWDSFNFETDRTDEMSSFKI